jgi:hypothetical protein
MGLAGHQELCICLCARARARACARACEDVCARVCVRQLVCARACMRAVCVRARVLGGPTRGWRAPTCCVCCACACVRACSPGSNGLFSAQLHEHPVHAKQLLETTIPHHACERKRKRPSCIEIKAGEPENRESVTRNRQFGEVPPSTTAPGTCPNPLWRCARGKWNVMLSVAMLSQYATWNKRHVHMARRKRVMVPYPCSCDMVQEKPSSPLLVDARVGRLFVLLACCIACEPP